jgi:hypothetical protein
MNLISGFSLIENKRFHFSLLPLGEGQGMRGEAIAKPRTLTPDPFPKGEGVNLGFPELALYHLVE